ncbi:MAG: DDE-type integrase/transposase/recombinase [Planctomycetes bacterium]|nr:DDE-type integrase/transposase/recombinase [Planctomycetota bacterium]
MRKRPRRSAAYRAEVLAAYLKGTEPAAVVAQRYGLPVSTLYAWTRTQREMSGEPVRRRRRRAGAQRASPTPAPRPSYPPEERRAAVEAYADSELTQQHFARTWGLSTKTLREWLRRYTRGGPKALEPLPPGRKPGDGPVGLPEPVREAVVETKRSFPDFGLRKVRDFLRRARGIAVSPRTIAKTLHAEVEAGRLELPEPPKRRIRVKREIVRRFERSKPRELWQSDITSFLLARSRQTVHLVVFLDDYSRFIVGWALSYQAKSDFVLEALRSAIGRYGAPKEVLTDQGRQYYAWRGKSVFQRFLQQEGIQHVVARAHHPQTVGKCERLWGTIEREFWARRMPQDLEEARERLGHFLAHVNFHRPHQSLGGLTPAERFFGAEDVAKAAIEAGIQRNELLLALGEKPRRPVFLYGQIGDQQVSLHGERGRLVLQTPEGQRTELTMDELGARSAAPEAEQHEEIPHDEEAKHDGAAQHGTSTEVDQHESERGAAGDARAEQDEHGGEPDGEPERAPAAPPSAAREEADALPHDPADGDPGARTLGGDH